MCSRKCLNSPNKTIADRSIFRLTGFPCAVSDLQDFFARANVRRANTNFAHQFPTSSSLRGSDASFAAAPCGVRERGHVEILNLPVAKVKVSDREKAPVDRTLCD